MSIPVRAPSEPPAEHSRYSLDELSRLPAGSTELEKPLPAWVTEAHMRWLETGDVPMDTEPTRSIHPGALTVREWMAGQRSNIDQEKGADRGGER